MYKDACDRNAVEGRNGNAKRRFGLDLIAAKLDETTKTEAALILVAMNAAQKLARWLLRFFSGKPFGANFVPAKGKNCIFSVDPKLASVIVKNTKKRCALTPEDQKRFLDFVQSDPSNLLNLNLA